MADPPRYPDTDDDAGVGGHRESTTSTPRWVYMFGVIAIVLILLFVGLQVFGVGGSHGPGRHTPSGDAGPSSVTENRTLSGGDFRGHTPSEGGHR